MKKWTEFLSYPGQTENCEIDFWQSHAAMTKEAIISKKPLYRSYFSCKNDPQVLVNILKAIRLNPLQKVYVPTGGGKYTKQSFISDDTYLLVEYRNVGCTIWIATFDEKKLYKTIDIAAKFVDTPKANNNAVHVMKSGPRGVSIAKIADISYELVSGNYSDRVNSATEHIITDLNSSEPCGKVSIISGPPGTGKTHLLRHIITKANKQMFVIIPPNIVASLNGPDLINCITNYKDEFDDLDNDSDISKNLVFIIEDADSVLSPRASDNMGSISSLLNFSDGIIGDVCNVRIITTTNENHQEFDRAIMRSGRLCRHILVDKLTPEHGLKVMNRLCGKDLTVSTKNGYLQDKSYSLADIYRLARKDGSLDSEEIKALGFETA